MATDSQIGRGIRRSFRGLGELNFETSGTTQYYCSRQPLTFLGTDYNVGDALPFDCAGTSYGKRAVAQLEAFWNNGWIHPLPEWDDIPGNWDDIPGNFDDVGVKS